MSPASSLARLHRVLFLAFGFALLARGVHASCGAESCSLENGAFGAGYRRFAFELSYQDIDQDGAWVGTHSASIGAIPSEADEVRTHSQTVLLKGQMSFNRRFVGMVQLPYIDRFHSHLLNEEGEEPALHEFQYSGIGDASVTGSYMVWGHGGEEDVTVSALAGVKLPTGEKHVDAIDGDEPEPHARLGTGSYDAIMGAHVMSFHSVPTFGGAPGMLPVFGSVRFLLTSRGTDDYRVGNTLDANLGTAYPLGDRLQFLAQANYRYHHRDDSQEAEEGEEPEGPVVNTGGQAFYLTPGLRFQAASLLSLQAYMQVPVYQKVNEIQLVSPYHLWFGVTYRMP